MPSFTGFILGDPVEAQWGDLPATAARSLDRTSAVHPFVALDGAAILAGAFTNNRQIATRSIAETGYRLTEFVDDFYNRIYLIPPQIDFGTIDGASTVQLLVWNAYFVPRTLLTAPPPAGSGVDLGSLSLPVTIGALVVLAINVTAEAVGSPQIAGNIPFGFDTPETVGLFIQGLRGASLPFDPDWSKIFKISREFKTDIITSRSGKEQRRALRFTPRKTFDFSILVYGAQLPTFQNFLIRAQATAALLTDTTRKVATVADLAMGASSVDVGITPPSWLAVGAGVAIRNGADQTLANVASIAGTVVTFAQVMPLDFPVGSQICASVKGFLKTELTSDRNTNEAATFAIQFDVDPASELGIAPPPAPLIWNGREVVLAKPDWGQTITGKFQGPYETLDYGQGLVTHYRPITFATRTLQATYVGKTNAEMEAIEQIFERGKGQRGEFYMPTFEPDLPLKDAIVAGATNFRIAGLDVFNTYSTDTVFRAVMILLNDETMIFAKVISIIAISDGGGNDTLVELAAPITIAIDPADVAMISWMPVWRHSSDLMTTEWLTDSVAQNQLMVETLEDLPAE